MGSAIERKTFPQRRWKNTQVQSGSEHPRKLKQYGNDAEALSQAVFVYWRTEMTSQELLMF